MYLILKGYCQGLYLKVETLDIFKGGRDGSTVYKYDGDQGTGYPALGVDDQPIGAWIRRRARLDQQSDHAAFILPPRPVKWVNARALRLDIRGHGQR